MWKDENNRSWDVCCDVECRSRWANYCPGVCVSDAQPTEMERDVWNQVNSVLQDSESILLGLQAYKGAGQEIRDVRNNAGAGCWRSPRLLMVDVRLTCSSVCFVLFLGNSKPEWLHAAGASLELRLPACHQTQEVLQFLSQTRWDHSVEVNVLS